MGRKGAGVPSSGQGWRKKELGFLEEQRKANVAGVGTTHQGSGEARWALAALLRILVFILREIGSHAMVYGGIRCPS